MGCAFALGLLIFVSMGSVVFLMLDSESIHDAVRREDVEGLMRILDRNPERIDARNRGGQTPLQMAAWRGKIGPLEELIRRKADVNARCNGIQYQNEGWTALHLAATAGEMESLRVLIFAGADVNTKTTKGWTPLDAALERGQGQAAIFLKAHGGMSGGLHPDF